MNRVTEIMAANLGEALESIRRGRPDDAGKNINDTIEMLHDLGETLEYEYPRSMWISMEVRKPKKNYLYLCRTENNYLSVAYYRGNRKWEGHQRGYTIQGVTHWAFLPLKKSANNF